MASMFEDLIEKGQLLRVTNALCVGVDKHKSIVLTRMHQATSDSLLQKLRSKILPLTTSKVDVDPRSFEFIHDKPPLPKQSK